MKKRILVLFSLFICITVIYFNLFKENNQNNSQFNSKKSSLKIERSLNSSENLKELAETEKYIKVKLIKSFLVEKIISFPISGMLEKGELILKVGSKVKKHDFLFQLNNKKYFDELVVFKRELKSILNLNFTNISQQFPNEVSKWQIFYNEISETDLLPKVPVFSSKNEDNYFREIKFNLTFAKIEKKESEAENYFYLSPIKGQIGEIYCRLNSHIRVNQKVATIINPNITLLTLKIHKKNEQFFLHKQKIKAQIVLLSSQHKTILINPNFVSKKSAVADSISLIFKVNSRELKSIKADEALFFNMKK
jgi:hypothetical protein